MRYRNCAEELRAIAEDFSGQRREFILTLVKDYDRQAAAEERLSEEEKRRS